ncbi:MAG: trypsin-like peptidase domain-containing protein [Elusimicrobiota bacterium]
MSLRPFAAATIAIVFALGKTVIARGEIPSATELHLRSLQSLASVVKMSNDAADQPIVRGTAFIVENGADGLFLLTNLHVVDDNVKDPDDLFRQPLRVKIEFTKADLANREGIVVGADSFADLALIKIDDSNASEVQRRRLASLTALPLGDSDSLVVGEELMTFGHPGGYRDTPTFVRYTGQGIFTEKNVPLIRFDGSVSPGNSGGLLMRMNGEVIGINTSMLPAPAQVAFAVPSGLVRTLILPQLRRFAGRPHERMRYGDLGIKIQNLTSDIMEVLDLPSRKGAIVTGVEPGAAGDFDGSGLKRGDVVLGVDGERGSKHAIEAKTLYSPWDLQNPKSPSNSLRVDIVPEHVINQGRASGDDAVWPITVIPDRKSRSAILSGPPPRNDKTPRFTGSRRTLLRMSLSQAMEGVWIDLDLNDVDPNARNSHRESFIRELYYRDANDRLVHVFVTAIDDIEKALKDKPSKVIVVISPDLRYGPASPSRYVVVTKPPAP